MKKPYIAAILSVAIMLWLWGRNAPIFDSKVLRASDRSSQSIASEPTFGDFGNGARLDPPNWVNGLAFTLSYPDMQPTSWPGQMTLWKQKEAGVSTMYQNRFPVYVMKFRYEPFELKDMGPRAFPRPKQMQWGFSANTERSPSRFNGLDILTSPSNKSEIRFAPSTESAFYVSSKDIPYDVLIRCGSYDCDAEVYSERTRFRYGLRFPQEGIAHAYDLIRTLDKLIVSWAAADNVVAIYYREHIAAPAALEQDAKTPDFCSSPRYHKVLLTREIKAPTDISVDSADNIFVVDSNVLQTGQIANKIYEMPSNTFGLSEIKQNYFSSDLGEIQGLALDGVGNVYISSGGSIRRAVKGGIFARRFFSFIDDAMGSYSIKFDRIGNLYSIDFQEGLIRKTQNPGKTGEMTSIVASGIYRGNALAADQLGAIYVTDDWLGVVHKIDSAGKKSIFASDFRIPKGIDLDVSGNIYVVDNSKAPIKKISPTGRMCAVTLDLHEYSKLAVSGKGNIYVTSQAEGSVTEFIPQY
ncbi:hypothetical protein [Collimonas humicola]|uniref:hypothetical protein n=1 Tax=Collimonas humicola TaxID=2825886 RepID=UPI001B8B0CDE|nr:hypothetical protein [Collimonas humicola]